MAAPGVQLNSEKHLEYFEPTVDQYVKKLEQALASKDLSAARQAHANLDRAMTAVHGSNSQATGGQDSPQVSAALEDVGTALENGDLTSADSAVGELRNNLSNARGLRPDDNGDGSQSTSVNSEDIESSSDGSQDPTGGKLDLRV